MRTVPITSLSYYCGTTNTEERILKELMEKPMTIKEMLNLFKLSSRPSLTKSLNELKDSGIVYSTTLKNSVYWNFNKDSLAFALMNPITT